MAGRAQKIGLPLVIEIVNARIDRNKQALTDVKAAVAGKKTVQVTGVWRVWFEHPSATAQTQGQTVPVPDDTNPKHVFEIHPATRFGADSVLASFVPIDGYKAHPAAKAFSTTNRSSLR